MYEKSYHTKVIKTDPRAQKREKIRRKKKAIIYSTVTVILLVGIVFLLRLNVLQLKTVQVSGTEVVDPVEIEQAVMADLQGKYLYVIPKTNIMLLPLAKMERNLAVTFPRLETISLVRTNASTLAVAVSEYHATYLWCVAACYFMDQKGTVYSKAPYFSGTTYPKVYSGELAALPFNPLKTADLDLVSILVPRLGAIKMPVEELHFETPHTLRINFSHHERAAELYVDPKAPLEEMLENIYSAIHTEPLASQYMNRDKRLLYIDVRYGDRVIYKFE